MSRKPETVFRKRVSDALKTLPNTVFFPIQQKTFVGHPDFLLCIRGRFVALELKSEKGVPSPLQRYNISKVIECGGLGYVVYPDNWKEILNVLKTLAKGDHGNDHNDK